MRKILVTTDLSDNSKAGVRFAIQLAEQTGVSLTFFYVHRVWSAETWNEERYEHYVLNEKLALQQELEKFIQDIYSAAKIKGGDYKCVIQYDSSFTDVTRRYAEQHDFDYICIATHGAGAIKKYFGTNTGRLITESAIPVICVPKNYRRRPVTSILYASDGRNHEQELRKVMDIAKPLSAQVDMVHMAYSFETVPDEAAAEVALHRKLKYDVDIHTKARNIELPLLDQVEKAVDEYKPSLLVMFTDQHRNFWERLLLSSLAEEYSFYTRVPLLVYSKDVNK